MHTLMANYLTTKAGQYAALAKATASKTEEDEEEKRRALLAAYLEAIESGEISWDDLPAQVAAILEPMVKTGAQDALNQLDVTSGIDFDVVNERAVEWAKDRSAELVGMKYVDGELVTNPRAEWSIEESTRESIRDLVAQGTEEGWSMDQLADAIAADAGFSDERAMTIARTESATADVQGNMVAYREARDQVGIVVLKEWITAGDDLVSEDCAANAEQGAIDLDDDFQSGASAPPDHPNCRCDVLPVRFPTDDDTADTGEGE